ncbi:hypothetical protein B046DRAFT_03311 [Streptomyces sp. LamerLS-316]|uniref:hypothetical protein n=1 Tax=unclassified Streptomyces TaxID=2593676 RepID=UPI0008238933|nr:MULTISPECIES: hypothetical protein [unclassified Streptomyces]MYQ38507.1 hypothetical protein [Streptomyces sp. SID4921]SCK37417.1 hypothetical protein B046DRAFT_03311 [Streptomyces sp. LamerLS-316]
MSVDQKSWEAAVRHLYEDAYPYDATGPRCHADWVLDVIALMKRVPDPRGWAGLDDAAENPVREASPTYPFVAHPSEYIAERLREIDRESAENLLLALTDDKCTLSNLARFTESPDELRAMARTILERFGDEATYHTNVNRPGQVSGTLDFSSSSWAYSPLSVYSEDYGLIVVSDTEVGMFWNFSDY